MEKLETAPHFCLATHHGISLHQTQGQPTHPPPNSRNVRCACGVPPDINISILQTTDSSLLTAVSEIPVPGNILVGRWGCLRETLHLAFMVLVVGLRRTSTIAILLEHSQIEISIVLQRDSFCVSFISPMSKNNSPGIVLLFCEKLFWGAVCCLFVSVVERNKFLHFFCKFPNFEPCLVFSRNIPQMATLFLCRTMKTNPEGSSKLQFQLPWQHNKNVGV